MRPPVLLAVRARGGVSVGRLSLLPLCRRAEPRRRARQLLTPVSRSICSAPDDAAPVFPKVVFSGIQPTGVLHLGNYYGAVQQWLRHQRDADCRLIVGIVDLHAITNGPVESELSRLRLDQMTACLLACGLCPDRTVLFQQSAVPEHCLLAWLLTCLSTVDQMNRLAQFKEKSAAFSKQGVPLGLLTYPVLQAADILLYKATHVPVGDDQSAHLGIARRLAERFNGLYGQHYFPIPQQVTTKLCRVKSLRYADRKMSKSSTSPDDDRGRLSLDDSADAVRLKVQRAVTDTTPSISFDPRLRPAVSNLVSLLATVTDSTETEVVERCRDMDTVAFKRCLADAIVDKFEPIRERYERLMADRAGLRTVIDAGSQRARQMAAGNIAEIRALMGF